MLDTEDEGTTILQNGRNHLPNNKESHSITPQFNIKFYRITNKHCTNHRQESKLTMITQVVWF